MKVSLLSNLMILIKKQSSPFQISVPFLLSILFYTCQHIPCCSLASNKLYFKLQFNSGSQQQRLFLDWNINRKFCSFQQSDRRLKIRSDVKAGGFTKWYLKNNSVFAQKDIKNQPLRPLRLNFSITKCRSMFSIYTEVILLVEFNIRLIFQNVIYKNRFMLANTTEMYMLKLQNLIICYM